MSGFISFATSGANLNLNNTEEALGFATDGTTVTVTAGSSNVKGSYVTIGTSTAAYAGFWLYYGSASASSARIILDIRHASTTVIVPDLYLEPNQSVGPCMIWIPLQVAAGLLEARCQAATGSQTVKVGIVGVLDNSQSAPMYTTMAALNIDTTNTRADDASVTLQDSAGTTYYDLVASTAATYNAFLFVGGHSGSNPVTSQQAKATFATGAAAAEVEFAWHSTWVNNSTSAFPNRPAKFIEKTIASGTRISAKVAVVTPGTDTVRFAAYGFA